MMEPVAWPMLSYTIFIERIILKTEYNSLLLKWLQRIIIWVRFFWADFQRERPGIIFNLELSILWNRDSYILTARLASILGWAERRHWLLIRVKSSRMNDLTYDSQTINLIFSDFIFKTKKLQMMVWFFYILPCIY